MYKEHINKIRQIDTLLTIMAYLDLLPDELYIHHIFQYLTPSDIYALASLNKRFRKLSFNEAMWSLSFKDPGSNLFAIYKYQKFRGYIDPYYDRLLLHRKYLGYTNMIILISFRCFGPSLFERSETNVVYHLRREYTKHIIYVNIFPFYIDNLYYVWTGGGIHTYKIYQLSCYIVPIEQMDGIIAFELFDDNGNRLILDGRIDPKVYDHGRYFEKNRLSFDKKWSI